MGPLFRPEALAGQRQAWLGSILLIRPLSLTLLCGLMVGSVALLVAYLVLGHYTRSTQVDGVLVPDLEWIAHQLWHPAQQLNRSQYGAWHRCLCRRTCLSSNTCLPT